MRPKLLLILFLPLGMIPLFAELKYFPKDKEELIALVSDEKIKLDEIDTSKITDMSYLFCLAEDNSRSYPYEENCGKVFREDFRGIEQWDTSHVETMKKMFDSVKHFNEPIGDWDVSNVKDMSGMFENAKSFNQPLEKWNVSKVRDMIWMFGGATSFNQPLEKWDVSNVKDMSGMFENAKSFNQPLGKWDVSQVENMAVMFSRATSFNQDLSSWDVRNVKDMSEMFNGASAFSYDFDWDLEGKVIEGGFIGGTELSKKIHGRRQ